MSEPPPRVVLDTVVFIQALISGRGAAAGCISELRAGRFVLLMSDVTFAELNGIFHRPKFRAKYSFVTDEKVKIFSEEIKSLAVTISNPPHAFKLPRDFKDEPFIDLAVAGDAQFIVTWNERHLTYLMRQDTPEGKDFCSRFPNLKIVSPPEFLAIISSRQKS